MKMSTGNQDDLNSLRGVFRKLKLLPSKRKQNTDGESIQVTHDDTTTGDQGSNHKARYQRRCSVTKYNLDPAASKAFVCFENKSEKHSDVSNTNQIIPNSQKSNNKVMYKRRCSVTKYNLDSSTRKSFTSFICY